MFLLFILEDCLNQRVGEGCICIYDQSSYDFGGGSGLEFCSRAVVVINVNGEFGGCWIV